MNFNPRSHERSDMRADRVFKTLLHFNPRSHERSDGAMFVGNNEFGIFQSTLPREERRSIALSKSSR